MNSEELEISLRTEFENYLNNNLAEIKQEISKLQEKFNAELERHKSQIDEFFEAANSNFEKERELEPSFKESVMEHLRLSKDEGAQITAKAFAQAEELDKENAKESVGIKEIYEAVSEISGKTTQSEILKTLVQHASQFTPRGAFFIIKNEHLVGWRVFGKEKGSADEKVKEVFLPLTSNSVLSESVKTLTTVSVADGGYEDDKQVLEGLEFGDPEKMLAIPLIARGRGVAVLYADNGSEGKEFNAEALETLVRVAGLTVEVLASNKNAGAKKSGSKKAATGEAEEENVSSTTPQTLLTGERFESEQPATVMPSYQGFVSEPAAAEPAFEPSYQTSLDGGEAYAPAETETTESEPAAEVADAGTATSEFGTEDYQFSDDSQIDEVKVAEPSYQSDEEKYPSYDSATWSTPEVSSDQTEAEPEYTSPEVAEETATVQEFQSSDFSSDFESFRSETQAEIEEAIPAEFDGTASPESEYASPVEEERYPSFEAESWAVPGETTPGFSAQEFAQNFAKESDPTDFVQGINDQTDSYKPYDAGSFLKTEDVETNHDQTFNNLDVETPKVETVEVSQPVVAAPKSRLSERNVDLPIEVSEDERRLHNDARRFARLLVSEIKLYNEQKVKEGREAKDLYDRLKEAIERSREMYDKRVQPAVASKFDYFHYELVNTLAEGDDGKLGGNYPGPNV